MKLRNLAQKTIDAYTYHVGRFARFLNETTDRTVDDATPEDIRSFQLHMIEIRKVGWRSFCAIRNVSASARSCQGVM